MILGKFVDVRVTLPINFCLGEDTALTIEFVVWLAVGWAMPTA